MEKYDAILKTINDKIADCERLIEFLRQENGSLLETNRMLNEKVAKLEKDLSEERQANAKLNEAYDRQRDELDDFKAANEALKAEINHINKF